MARGAYHEVTTAAAAQSDHTKLDLAASFAEFLFAVSFIVSISTEHASALVYTSTEHASALVYFPTTSTIY